jgi:hypothetical protein
MAHPREGIMIRIAIIAAVTLLVLGQAQAQEPSLIVAPAPRPVTEPQEAPEDLPAPAVLEPSRVAPAPRPAFLPPLKAQESPELRQRRRRVGIAFLVLGNLVQAVGASVLFPGVMHRNDAGWGHAPVLIGVGGALVGFGNLVEGAGWGLRGSAAPVGG